MRLPAPGKELRWFVSVCSATVTVVLNSNPRILRLLRSELVQEGSWQRAITRSGRAPHDVKRCPARCTSETTSRTRAAPVDEAIAT